MAQEEKQLPKSVSCPYCAGDNPLHVWVYAHWNDRLRGHCQHCSKFFKLFRGETSKTSQRNAH